MVKQWASAGNIKGPQGDPGPLAPGGSYLTGTVPAGSTTVTITHNLGTRDLVVMVRETTGYSYVPVANDAPDANTVRLNFATAPGTGEYRYVIFAALGTEVSGPVAPTAHAPSHASGGTDPLSPSAIGAAESGHTHSGFAPTVHGHDAADISSGTLAFARVPTGTSSSTVAVGSHTHSDYAVSGHSHPAPRGPYSPATIPATALAAGPRTVTTVTIPDPGFTWFPLCFAELEIRTDIGGTRPALWVRDGSATGQTYANGAIPTETTAYTLVQAIPRGNVTPLTGSRELHLVVANLYGGGWIQTTDLNKYMTVFVLPA